MGSRKLNTDNKTRTTALKAKKKRVKKPRNPDALNAIVKCKGGSHKDKRNKRKRRDDLWKQELQDK